MSEEKPDVQELSNRISQLLDVLSMLAEDLHEVVNTLKSMKAPPTPAAPIPAPSPEGLRDVEDVKVMFPENLENLLSFEAKEEFIIIKPRQYLGSENFAKIASIIRGAGGEYISAGKGSHFRVPREMR